MFVTPCGVSSSSAACAACEKNVQSCLFSHTKLDGRPKPKSIATNYIIMYIMVEKLSEPTLIALYIYASITTMKCKLYTRPFILHRKTVSSVIQYSHACRQCLYIPNCSLTVYILVSQHMYMQTLMWRLHGNSDLVCHKCVAQILDGMSSHAAKIQWHQIHADTDLYCIGLPYKITKVQLYVWSTPGHCLYISYYTCMVWAMPTKWPQPITHIARTVTHHTTDTP